jgi:hypothetical protein
MPSSSRYFFVSWMMCVSPSAIRTAMLHSTQPRVSHAYLPAVPQHAGPPLPSVGVGRRTHLSASRDSSSDLLILSLRDSASATVSLCTTSGG